MEEELLLKQPLDRRLGTASTLPPGPPGAEYDALDLVDAKNAPKNSEKETLSKSSRRRRTPSYSPPPLSKRRGFIRGCRTPPSPRPSPPRRSRYYSPDRRRYDNNRGRRTPPRRSPRRGNRDYRDRFRGRGRSDSRSRSRSRSPTPRRNNRWSPKRKQPHSPPPPPPNISAVAPNILTQQMALQSAQSQYNVVPQQMYGGVAPYNQYNVPPPQAGYIAQNDVYNTQMPVAAAQPIAATPYNTSYPPPSNWGVVNEPQFVQPSQPWIQQSLPDTTQVQQVQQTQQVQHVKQVQTPVQQPQKIAKPNVLPDAAPGTVELNSAHDAVAQEAFQRDALRQQRISCFKKAEHLKSELNLLLGNRKDLCQGKGPLSPTTKSFLDENDRLEATIRKKLTAIESVVEMLSGVIGNEGTEDLQMVRECLAKEMEQQKKDAKKNGDSTAAAATATTTTTTATATAATTTTTMTEPEPEVKQQSKIKRNKASTSVSSTDDSTTDNTTSASGSSSSSEEDGEIDDDDDDEDNRPNKYNANVPPMTTKAQSHKAITQSAASQSQLKTEKIAEERKRYNYIFYDPEMHWCQTCDTFPKTAKDFLNHLHSKEHMDREAIDTPWHAKMVNDQYPVYDNVITKRTPIRGLSFFVPATAWYCKLCNIWMGDLHCASTHLKSQLHSHRYNIFLEKNPQFEANWIADRQRVLNEKKTTPLPPQITSISTTAVARNKSKKSKRNDDEKHDKKRKKKIAEKKDKKKKKKSTKKRKRATAAAATHISGNAATSSSSSSGGSESDESEQAKKTIVVNQLNNPNPMASIRVAMRKQDEAAKLCDNEKAPPPPSMTLPGATATTAGGRLGKWTVTQEAVATANAIRAAAKVNEEDTKNDDSIMQQWNTVQPVISESEKKLLEQLKGKLKSKTRESSSGASIPPTAAASNARNVLASVGKENHQQQQQRRDVDKNVSRRSRSPAQRGSPAGSVGRRGYGRSRSRSRSRSRGRFRRGGGGGRRSRSRSRGGWFGRRRGGRSRSRSLRRRSRSRDRRRRYSRSFSRSRTRTRSNSRNRVEKPIVTYAEFRPRVPEKDKEAVKKLAESREKKEAKRSKTVAANAAAATLNTTSGKKLPFIGKMPVLKKQTSAQPEGVERNSDEQQQQFTTTDSAGNGSAAVPNFGLQQRAMAPTAAQIQMAMMEDVYGNAPPFHPDTNAMVDYDDLMPDPVQFVNLMGQVPPPPPPPPPNAGHRSNATDETDDEADMLPPGIDENESEEFTPKPLIVKQPSSSPKKATLPKDLEEALNIIFPGEKKPGDGDDDAKTNEKTGETNIIQDDSIMQANDLVKDGIHMISIEEASIAGGDDASQISMNEPLNFAKRATAVAKTSPRSDDEGSANVVDNDADNAAAASATTAAATAAADVGIYAQLQFDDASSQNAADNDLSKLEQQQAAAQNSNCNAIAVPERALPTKKPCATAEEVTINKPIAVEAVPAPVASVMYDLDDIPQPPDSPTDSEKIRRQEELCDLAMLGIDADDMAAQCI